MPPPNQIKKIAICGAGVGGLTLAAVISKNCDIAVDIYEAKPELTTIGTGIAIWKRFWQVLMDLGLDEQVKKRNIPLPREGEVRGPVFRKAGQPYEGFDFHNHMMPYGPTSVPRRVLFEMLKDLLSEKCTIHTSKRMVDYKVLDSSKMLKLMFSDGSSADADVLVGADGVHSMIRATMYRDLAANAPTAGYDAFIDPIWSGTHAYRCTINLANFKARHPNHQALASSKIWCGKGKHIVTHPNNDIMSLICFYSVETGEGTPYDGPWVTDVSSEEVIGRFQGWEPDLVELLSELEKSSRWAIHVVRPLPFNMSGRVALLGDAAHAMTPHQGVGGGQAIEDAYVLGHLLAHPQTTLDNIESVLKIYQEVRLPLGAAAAERSRTNGTMYDFIHPDFPVTENSTADDLKPMGEAIGNSFGWLAKGGVVDDWKHAEGILLNKSQQNL